LLHTKFAAAAHQLEGQFLHGTENGVVSNITSWKFETNLINQRRTKLVQIRTKCLNKDLDFMLEQLWNKTDFGKYTAVLSLKPVKMNK
jgi:hypothetical protein